MFVLMAGFSLDSCPVVQITRDLGLAWRLQHFSCCHLCCFWGCNC